MGCGRSRTPFNLNELGFRCATTQFVKDGMIRRLSRRTLGKATAAAAALAVSRVWASARAASEDKTLRFIAQADLRILDPIWTTAYITRNHGYMVFDTPFAIDSEFMPHPADGRRLRSLAGQTDLPFQIARWACIP